jgi:hypothetical protein
VDVIVPDALTALSANAVGAVSQDAVQDAVQDSVQDARIFLLDAATVVLQSIKFALDANVLDAIAQDSTAQDAIVLDVTVDKIINRAIIIKKKLWFRFSNFHVIC